VRTWAYIRAEDFVAAGGRGSCREKREDVIPEGGKRRKCVLVRRGGSKSEGWPGFFQGEIRSRGEGEKGRLIGEGESFGFAREGRQRNRCGQSSHFKKKGEGDPGKERKGANSAKLLVEGGEKK